MHSAILIISGSRLPGAVVTDLSGVAWLCRSRTPARWRLGRLRRAADRPVAAYTLWILQLVKPPRVLMSLFFVSHSFPPLGRDCLHSQAQFQPPPQTLGFLRQPC